MALHQCDLRDDRRSLRKETREIEDVRDGDELERIGRSMARSAGRKTEGLTLRVRKLDRRGGIGPKVAEVSL